MVGLVTIDGILRQRALAPSIDTANAVDIQVDIQINETTTLDLVRMASTFKVFLAIVPSTDAEGLETTDL